MTPASERGPAPRFDRDRRRRRALRRYPDEFAAYADQGGEPGREDLLVPLIAWLKEVAAR